MTVIPLTLSGTATPPFQTLVALDGKTYNLIVKWSLAVQRWYLSLTDQAGNVAWNGALVGSPLTSDIPLAPGVFQTSTILFREDSGNFEVNP